MANLLEEKHIYMVRRKQLPVQLGTHELVDDGETRARYIEALRAADNSDIAPLLTFARS